MLIISFLYCLDMLLILHGNQNNQIAHMLIIVIRVKLIEFVFSYCKDKIDLIMIQFLHIVEIVYYCILNTDR
jgi:hypothetical protein